MYLASPSIWPNLIWSVCFHVVEISSHLGFCVTTSQVSFYYHHALNHPFITHDHSWVPKWVDRHITLAIILFFYFTGQGLSKGVGFIRFDQRVEAERAIQKLNGTIPEGATEPITVKFANNPSNNAKAIPPLAAYLAPQAARRAFGGALHPAGRFRYVISW